MMVSLLVSSGWFSSFHVSPFCCVGLVVSLLSCCFPVFESKLVNDSQPQERCLQGSKQVQGSCGSFAQKPCLECSMLTQKHARNIAPRKNVDKEAIHGYTNKCTQ